MKLGRIIERHISIKPSSNNGLIVTVGCGIFVFADKESFLAALSEYLDNPESYEKQYNSLPGDFLVAAPAPGEARPERVAPDECRR